MTRDISRQAFIRGALGTVAAGALGSCGKTTPDLQAPPSTSGPARQPDWHALDGAVEGPVVLPSSAEYAAAKSLFNSRFDNSTPAAVVSVKSSSDVQKAIAFAARSGIKLAARSGGHSYIGASAANSAMVIDLRQLPGRDHLRRRPRAGDDSRCSTTGFGAGRAGGGWTVDPERQLSDRWRRRADARWRTRGRRPEFGVGVRRAGVGLRRAAERRRDHRVGGRSCRPVLGTAGGG